jgi:hypothetical protein
MSRFARDEQNDDDQPIAYIYRVHIDRKAQGCARHRTATASFAGIAATTCGIQRSTH